MNYGCVDRTMVCRNVVGEVTFIPGKRSTSGHVIKEDKDWGRWSGIEVSEREEYFCIKEHKE